MLNEYNGTSTKRTGDQQARFVHASMGCYYARIEFERVPEHASRCIAALEPLAAGRPSDGFILLTLGQAALAGPVESLYTHHGDWVRASAARCGPPNADTAPGG